MNVSEKFQRVLAFFTGWRFFGDCIFNLYTWCNLHRSSIRPNSIPPAPANRVTEGSGCWPDEFLLWQFVSRKFFHGVVDLPIISTRGRRLNPTRSSLFALKLVQSPFVLLLNSPPKLQIQFMLKNPRSA